MTEIEKVRATFAGISAGDADRAVEFIDPERFVQHNPHVTDGAAELRALVAGSPREELRLEVVCAFEDSPYVFAQAEGLILGRGVFRFKEGLVVEHWGFPEAVPPGAEWKNGNGML